MNIKQLTAIITLIAITMLFINWNNNQKTSSFQQWKSTYGITYHSQIQNIYRQKIFTQKLNQINTHNSNSNKKYEKGINQFTALTQEEFVQTYLGLLVPETISQIDSKDTLRGGNVNWKDLGAVTPMKNQGMCGSCWAFGATGGLEGLSKLTNGTLENFSEQQLVDCSRSYKNHGCDGGLMTYAYSYVIDKGIVHQTQYPYFADDMPCTVESGPFKISAYTQIKDCDTLSSALINQPISVGVDATMWSSYKSGTFDDCKKKLNHGVVLVGMTDNYWYVKNSWGTGWGIKGYIQLARGNSCGICNMASFPKK